MVKCVRCLSLGNWCFCLVLCLQAYSDEEQRLQVHSTFMQNAGHFQYLYRDEYFSNLCEWKQKHCLLFSLIFPRYCTAADGECENITAKYGASFLFLFALKHAVEPKCRVQLRYVLLSGLLFYALHIFKLWGQHTYVSSFLDMHCKTNAII